MLQNLLIKLKAVGSNIPPELFCIGLILLYLGLYILGLYFSSKTNISFFKSVGLTALVIGMIIFTQTGGNIFMGVIVASSHILIASIIRMTSCR